jgi:hypothetical protein
MFASVMHTQRGRTLNRPCHRQHILQPMLVLHLELLQHLLPLLQLLCSPDDGHQIHHSDHAVYVSHDRNTSGGSIVVR